jgi:1,2-dihydroxy-3-keto-5-methylthiopentene dioxygenase
MSLLITWPDDDPSRTLTETADPAAISDALTKIGCRFQRHQVRPGVDAGTGQDGVLAVYRDLVGKIVSAEGFVTVDVASAHPGDDPGWLETARALRAKFIDEHTHGEDDEVRWMVRGTGVFYLHIGNQVHAVCAGAGDLLGVPRHTTHWFDTLAAPDFTAIRFFHNPQGWAGIPTGSDISRRFPDGDAIRERARAPGGA